MDMFNQKSIKERIGGTVKKSKTLEHLREVEKYFLTAARKHKIEASYDVVANELPYFKTLGYTEWAHSFIVNPLQQWLRVGQLQDAYNDNAEIKVDYVDYFKNKVLGGTSNKYSHITERKTTEDREFLVVLVGSNVLKDRICLNKLKWIRDTYEQDVWFKPHPLTNYQLVGELQDILGKELVLDRDENMYQYLVNAKTVFTSHMSESAVYAVCLDKEIDPIDLFNKVEQGSFFHINKFLFTEQDPKAWINRTFNSYKCGIINPEVDSNWKQKLDQYLDYIMDKREQYKNKYVYK